MRAKNGFTLVEILFVLVIAIAIAAFAVPSYRRAQERAAYEAARGELIALNNAVNYLEREIANDGYTYSFPASGSYSITNNFNTASSRAGLTQVGCLLTAYGYITESSQAATRDSRFLTALLTKKYFDKLQTGSYDIFAVSSTSNSVCNSNCKDANVRLCMCEKTGRQSTGCFYGAKVFRDGRIEKFTNGCND